MFGWPHYFQNTPPETVEQARCTSFAILIDKISMQNGTVSGKGDA
jgi:hypothetical protein